MRLIFFNIFLLLFCSSTEMDPLDGHFIVATDYEESKVHVLDSTLDVVHSFSLPRDSWPMCCSVKPNTSLVAVPNQTAKKVYIFDAERRTEERVIDLPLVSCSAGFSSSGRFLALGSRDGQVAVLNTRDGVHSWAPIATLNGLSNSIYYDVQFSMDETLLVAVGYYEKAIVWRVDVQTNQFTELKRLPDGHPNYIFAVAIHPTDNRIVTVTGWDTIVEWRMESDRFVDHHRSLLTSNAIDKVRFSPDGSLITTGTAVYRSNDWTMVRSFTEAGGVDSIKFCPDGKHIVMSNREGTVNLYSLEQEAPIRSSPKFRKFIFGLGGIISKVSCQPLTLLCVRHILRAVGLDRRQLQGVFADTPHIYKMYFSHS
jgi:WD40 repeat protein